MPERRWFTTGTVVIHERELTADERQRVQSPLERCSFFSLSGHGLGLSDWQLSEMAAATGAPRSWLADRNRVREHILQAFESGRLVGLRRSPFQPGKDTNGTNAPDTDPPKKGPAGFPAPPVGFPAPGTGTPQKGPAGVPTPGSGSAGAQTITPTLRIPEAPGSSVWVTASGLHVYLVRFSEGAATVKHWMPAAGKPPEPVTTGEAYFYFSHRDDLAADVSRFAKDKSKLPLIGPVQLNAGDREIKLDIWSQNDWVIVRGAPLDGDTADAVLMAEQRDDYQTTYKGVTADTKEPGHWIYGSPREKDNQERWLGGKPTAKLVKLSDGGQHFWAGTLSAPPTPKLKLLLIKGGIGAGSYNELIQGSQNLDLPGHHLYDRALVAKLEALKPSSPKTGAVDALPEPPARFILPGDCCWQDQGQTNNCGAYSFSTAMNYWFPYTNYPGAKDGKWYSDTSRVPSVVNGARSPRNIEQAAKTFGVNGTDHDAEKLDQARALKLLKCWVMAGVPTLVLVKEDSAAGAFKRMISYHWKTVVGWDGDRLFMNNSGGDQETLDSLRVIAGFDYDHAPVGNDIDPLETHWAKWKAGGGDIVDFLSSVDECTFIPIYPKDPKFAGDKPR